MLALLTTVHVLVALVLILVVLLQSARGTDLAGAFGGMGSQTAFGPRGTATFLSKTTTALAAIFMVTSLTLSMLSNRIRGRSSSVLSGEKTTATKPQPLPPTRQGLPTQPNMTVIPVAPTQQPQIPGVTGTTAPGTPATAVPTLPGQPKVTVTQVPPQPPATGGQAAPGNSQQQAPPAQTQPNESPPKTSP